MQIGSCVKRRALLVRLAGAAALPGLRPAAAHGPAAHGGAPARATEARREQQPWGIAGEASAVRRTIAIRMSDQMRFTPERIEVTQGETVRLRVSNAGRLMHELVIGDAQSLRDHAELMKKFPDMEHDEPHMAHVGPGRRAELVWNFNRAGEFHFACLIAGHYDAGMIGTVVVLPR